MLIDNGDDVVKVGRQLSHVDAEFDKILAFANTLVCLAVQADGFLIEDIVQAIASLNWATEGWELSKGHSSFRVERTMLNTF